MIGRFTTIDPLAEQRVWVSPFNYGQNNPINRNDPTGALDDWVMDENKKPYWNPKVSSANDKDLQKGHTYLGKEVEYLAKNGGTVELHDGGKWNYKNETAWQKNDLESVETLSVSASSVSGTLPTLSTEAKEGVDALGLVTAFGEVGAAIAKTEPTASQALISSTTKVLGVAGKALGATSALNDFSTIMNKGFSNATAADWTKFGISTGSLLLKSNPYTIGFGIIYGIADMSGYNPVDYIYGKTIIP